MIVIVRIRYRNYAHYTLYRSCLLLYGITIVRLLSFLFPDDFEGNANISVAIKSGYTVAMIVRSLYFSVYSMYDVRPDLRQL